METGQRIFQTNNNTDSTLQNKLSIQVSLSGLSFCVLNKPSKRILHHSYIAFNKIVPPIEVLKQLKEHLSSNKLFQQDFKDVTVIHDNALATLVPKSLFNKNNLSDYLKFNSKILNNDFITFDELSQNEIINVYVPYVNINNFIFDTYGTFEYNHYSTLLINTLFEIHDGGANASMYVNIRSNHFEIVILKNKELILFNSFEYKTEEDFLGAGSIIHAGVSESSRNHLLDSESEKASTEFFRVVDGSSDAQSQLVESFRQSLGGRNLIELGMESDLILAAAMDQCCLVPCLCSKTGRLVSFDTLQCIRK